MSGYDTAQICRNGHVINDTATRYPQHNVKFCSKCGAEAMSICKECRAPIRGQYHAEGVVVLGGEPMDAPAFCYACGRPYPWTQAALQAGRELIAESMNLNDEEKALLTKSLHEIATDTPQTPLAAARVKRLLAKAGAEVGGALKEVVTKIATEAAKRLLFGGA